MLNKLKLWLTPPKIRVENQPKILPFPATVTRIEQRGKEFFLGQWKITTEQLRICGKSLMMRTWKK